MNNPEQKPMRITAGGALAPLATLNPRQREYWELAKTGRFSIFQLCEYYHKAQQPIGFREIWDFLLKLHEAGLLQEPQPSDWRPPDLKRKIQGLASSHAGLREKIKAEELQVLPFFRKLKPELIEFLAGHSSVSNVGVGTQLCLQGQSDRSLFVLLAGQASIYKNVTLTKERMLLARAEQGAILGETAFFLGEPRTADIIMSAPGKILKINFCEELDEIIKTDVAQSLRERFWFLQAMVKSPLLVNLPETSFDQLLLSGKLLKYQEGHCLFQEGDASDFVYFVVQGSLLVTQQGQKINILNSGDCVGEIGFLSLNQKRSATVTTQTNCLLMQVPNYQLIQIVFNNLALGLLLENLASERLQKDHRRRVSC
jgi:CRP-like cAMP-binding protein